MRCDVIGLAVLLATGSGVSVANGQGSIGVYGDAGGVGTQVSAPPFVLRTLHILANVDGQTAGGMAGAEFRILVANPNGYMFNYTAPDSAQVMGDPLSSVGANLAWPHCWVPNAGGRVSLGTVQVVNLGAGASTVITVEARQPPTSPGHECALFVLCDNPQFSLVCTNAPANVSCSLTN